MEVLELQNKMDNLQREIALREKELKSFEVRFFHSDDTIVLLRFLPGLMSRPA